MIFSKKHADEAYALLREQQKGKHSVTRYDLYNLFTTINVINGKRNRTSMINGEQLSEYNVGGFVKECIVPWFIGISGDQDTDINLLSPEYDDSSKHYITYSVKEKIFVEEVQETKDGNKVTVEVEKEITKQVKAEFLDPEEFEKVQRKIYRTLGVTLDTSTLESVDKKRKIATLDNEITKKYAYKGRTFKKSSTEDYKIPVLLKIELYVEDELEKDVDYAFNKRITRWVLSTVK